MSQQWADDDRQPSIADRLDESQDHEQVFHSPQGPLHGNHECVADSEREEKRRMITGRNTGTERHISTSMTSRHTKRCPAAMRSSREARS
jgi:hypothetical protein